MKLIQILVEVVLVSFILSFDDLTTTCNDFFVFDNNTKKYYKNI